MAPQTSARSKKPDDAPSAVAESPNMQSSMDAEKTKKKKKKKKSEKSTSNAPASPTRFTNGAEESADDTRSAKRKRDLEPEQKKAKKAKSKEPENDLNGFNTLAPTEDARDQNADSPPPSQPSPKETPTFEPSAPSPKKGREKKLRGPRIGGKNNQKIGFFTADEVNLLEGYKVQFCNTHNFANDMSRFDAMVQHSERTGVDFPCPPEICTKPTFWADIYALIPSRDRRSVYRFMRRHFQDSMQKAHDWTPEQDKELIELMELHPNKFAQIAKLLGRSDDDVTQRWKNRLQHRDKQNRGAWIEPELRGLLAAVQTAWEVTSMTAANLAGKDVYQMDEKHVSWGTVSDSMNNSRTRQQCADKWRKIRKHVLTLRATTDPEAEFDPVESARRSSRWGENNMLKPKSQQTVKDDDDEADIDVQQIPPSTPASTPGSSRVPKVGFMNFIKSLTSRVANDPTPTPSSQPQPESTSRVNDSEGPGETDVNEVNEATEPKKAKKSKKRKHSDVEPVAETELPSPVKSQTGEKDQTEKSEKKRRKKERKEREKREREEAEQAAAREAEKAAAKEAEQAAAKEAEKAAAKRAKKAAAKRAKKAAKEAEKAAAKEAEEAAAKAAERAEYKAAKKARKEAKKEKKLRKSLAEADEDAAPVATPSPKKSKKSKHRQSTSEPNGSTAAEPEQPESSKKSKKSKKSKRDRESTGDIAHANGDSNKSKKSKKEKRKD